MNTDDSEAALRIGPRVRIRARSTRFIGLPPRRSLGPAGRGGIIGGSRARRGSRNSGYLRARSEPDDEDELGCIWV